MSTLAQLAVSYRIETVRIAMRVKEIKTAGGPAWEIKTLETMLREMRVKQRVLASYYDSPRDASITMAGAYAPRIKGDGS